jgi:hypothetical protein
MILCDLKRAFCLLVAAGILAFHPPATLARDNAAPAQITRSYEEWVASCRQLPSNRSLRGRFPPKETAALKNFAEFDVVLSAFLDQCQNGSLRKEENWVGASPGNSGFFDISRAYFLRPEGGAVPVHFQPFAQKLSVPANGEVFLRGDLHGDIQSFVGDLDWLNSQKYLRGFEITRTNFYMVFLGDYTDRGMFGSEVLYTMMRLKLANPERVYMVRGNHEDISLQARYGFMHEGRAKFGASFNIAKIARAYDFLPVVLYLESGANAIQCNHGGMEPGYDPRALLEADGSLRFQLLGKVKQQQFFRDHPEWTKSFTSSSRDLLNRAMKDYEPEDPVSPTVLGFMWNDFSVLGSDSQFSVDPDRAYIFGERATQYILQNASGPKRKLQAVFRAHQHSSVLNPMMRRLVASRGVFRHWQSTDSTALLEAPPQEIKKHIDQADIRPIPTGSVWTFNVAPDSAYGEGCGFTFDTFAVLQTSRDFDDWRLRIVNPGTAR